jgi:tetratricopeptide (TPR) repeat protein
MNVEMLTPAMKYRRDLKELSGHDRMIMRLENRINKNRQKWVRASVIVQSFARAGYARRVKAKLLELSRLLRLKLKHLDDALACLRAGRFAEAIVAADAALALDPMCVEALRVRGHTMLRRHQYSEAMVEYSRVLEIDTEHLDCRMARARCLGHLREWDSAMEDIESLMDRDPGNPEYETIQPTCKK